MNMGVPGIPIAGRVVASVQSGFGPDVVAAGGGAKSGDVRMPRIKELLAQGKVVRLFGVGQLCSPKLIEIVGEHGGFDGLWLDVEHAGLGMRDIELATLA